jgi:hypothetical protein
VLVVRGGLVDVGARVPHAVDGGRRKLDRRAVPRDSYHIRLRQVTAVNDDGAT